MSTVTVLNPATEQQVAEVELATVAETDAAVERAHAAFPAWRDVA
ncbi:MAG: aldehyde dehydrogenase family protein, partial [Nocardioidaceae bacterium]